MLSFAPSKIFQLYYFRMFISLIIVGFLHGFILLPLFLSMFNIDTDRGYNKKNGLLKNNEIASMQNKDNNSSN